MRCAAGLRAGCAGARMRPLLQRCLCNGTAGHSCSATWHSDPRYSTHAHLCSAVRNALQAPQCPSRRCPAGICTKCQAQCFHGRCFRDSPALGLTSCQSNWILSAGTRVSRGACSRSAATHVDDYWPCFSCKSVQIVTAVVGSIAVESTSMCLIVPFLSTTNVVRRANSYLSPSIG